MLLQSLVQQHGPRVVYERGEAALGYPPTLVSERDEAVKVLKSLP